jgi:hypothetical protein
MNKREKRHGESNHSDQGFCRSIQDQLQTTLQNRKTIQLLWAVNK